MKMPQDAVPGTPPSSNISQASSTQNTPGREDIGTPEMNSATPNVGHGSDSPVRNQEAQAKVKNATSRIWRSLGARNSSVCVLKSSGEQLVAVPTVLAGIIGAGVILFYPITTALTFIAASFLGMRLRFTRTTPASPTVQHLQEAAGNIGGHLSGLARDVSKHASDMAKEAQSAVHDLQDRQQKVPVEKQVNDLKSAAGDIGTKVSDKAQAAGEQASDMAKEALDAAQNFGEKRNLQGENDIDEALQDSFPASDPPSNTPTTGTGTPHTDGDPRIGKDENFKDRPRKAS